MQPAWLLTATLALTAAQAAAMLVDELLYHRRRGLGRFERLGHPLDTALFLAPLVVAATQPPDESALALFAVLGLVSTLAITKDEFIHARVCAPGEQWLHAVLFVLHAPVLIGVACVWWQQPEALFLRMLPLAVGAWGFYQIIFWGAVAWRASTTPSTTNSATAGTTTTHTPSPSCAPSRSSS